MEFHPEHCKVEQLALEVRDVVRPLAEKKGLRLTWRLHPALIANIDPGRFQAGALQLSLQRGEVHSDRGAA